MRTGIISAFLLLAIFGCKKDGGGLAAQVQGKWELTSSFSAWTGQHVYPAGNGNTIVFNGNSFSQQINAVDTTYTYSGTFEIFEGKPCDFAKEQTLFKADGNAEAQSISLNNNELTLGTTECIADGGSSTYRKIH